MAKKPLSGYWAAPFLLLCWTGSIFGLVGILAWVGINAMIKYRSHAVVKHEGGSMLSNLYGDYKQFRKEFEAEQMKGGKS